MANQLLSGEMSVLDWMPSQNDYDWLGHGIYFWEHGPARAMRWAEEKARATGEEPAVLGAIVQLGNCFDLTDEQNTTNIGAAYDLVKASFDAAGKDLPKNRGNDADLKGRYLDCLVINYYLEKVAAIRYQSVRCAFREGTPAYDGSMIYRQTHIQVAVIDRSCILGVFRPT
jgi:hypothetical protein